MESNTFSVTSPCSEIRNFRPGRGSVVIHRLNPEPRAPHLYRVC
jgi:hypothetical protein